MIKDCDITNKDLIEVITKLVNRIPNGKVTTYNAIAEALGSKYARKYIWSIIKTVDGPWWRVVNEKGEIKDKKQLELLRDEGINIENGKIVDLEKYLFLDFDIDYKPLQILRDCQKRLVDKIVLKDYIDSPETFGGVDISYGKDKALVVYIVIDRRLDIIETKFFVEEVDFPYIPTFLAFREGRPIIKHLKKLDLPDILFVNGQGIAHPVKLGLATYVGVLLNTPTIGVTKKHLYGYIRDNKIYDKENNLIGGVIEKFGKRIYVSPGNKVSVETSIRLSEELWVKGQYPEPIRVADNLSKMYKNKYLLGKRSIKDYF